MKKIILLCNDNCTSHLVAQLLARENCLDAILVTAAGSTLQKLRRRARQLGLLPVLSQVACALSARILYQLRGGAVRRQAILASMDMEDAWPEGVRRMVLPGVNSEQTLRSIQALAPDLVVVNGTAIIKKAVLNCTPAPFINIHCGITPAYRGVHGGFWAIYENRSDLLGVTLHFVDEGVDSGPVIAQALARWDAGIDGFLNLPLLQYKAALPLLKQFIQSGALQAPLVDGAKSRQWFYPGLWTYLSMVLCGRIRY